MSENKTSRPAVSPEPLPIKIIEFFANRLLVGYISTIRPDEYPSVVPVGIMIHDGKVRISSQTASYKIRNLRQNPRVAICIPDPANPTRYIMIRGTAEIADDSDRVFVTWMAQTHMGKEQYPYEPNHIARTVITIKPDHIVMPKVHSKK